MNNIRDRLISVFEINGFFLPVNSKNNDVNSPDFDDTFGGESTDCDIFPDINIAEFDISSLDFISIMISIEDEFGISLPDEKISLELFNSFNGLVEFITDIVQN
mgnify:CR=1 FL=1